METLTKDRVFSQVPVLEEEYWADVDNRYRQYRAEIEENSIAARERKIQRESEARGFTKGRAEGRSEGHAEGLAKGHAEGLAEGLAKGRSETTDKIIRRQIEKGHPFVDIADTCGVSIEYVQNLEARLHLSRT